MATINSKSMIDQIIKNDGWIDSCLEDKDAPDNPSAVKIVEYTNAWGTITYGVVFAGEGRADRYQEPSHYVQNPKVIWVKGVPR